MLSAMRAGPRPFGTVSNAVERPCWRQRARTAVATPASSGRRNARRPSAGSLETIGPPLDGSCLAPQPAATSATTSRAITHKARTSRAYGPINRFKRGTGAAVSIVLARESNALGDRRSGDVDALEFGPEPFEGAGAGCWVPAVLELQHLARRVPIVACLRNPEAAVRLDSGSSFQSGAISMPFQNATRFLIFRIHG